jgi:predicted AlkP superfamily phosphohydrolase/phosphomutase
MGFAVFGVDSLPFSLITEHEELFPFLHQLYRNGQLREIRSCTPPVTIPAWSVISTGHDPGELGTYGFYRRSDFSYRKYEMAESGWIHYPRIWSQNNAGKNYIISVPQTYPVSPVNGCLISGILTPDYHSNFIWPKPEQTNINKLLAPETPMFDIHNFRRTNPEELIPEIEKMFRQKIKLIEHYLSRCHKSDCLFSVLIEPDRVNHAFWNYAFDNHPLFRNNKTCREFFFSFYRRLDQKLEYWFEQACRNGQTPLILSDHGARSLKGSFCINEWLKQTGFLKLQQPQSSGKIVTENINWAESSIWAEGGYVGKLFFNLAGREKYGFCRTDQLKKQLNEQLKLLQKKTGLKIEIIYPEKIYKRCAKIAPDAFILIDELNYRCAAGLHEGELLIPGNDTGPDAVNHDFQAIAASNVKLKLVSSIQDIYGFLLEQIS